ncbi:MAG: nucleoside deaminase [Pirellulaceae bacterium]|nr:nucleoside deaminase [Pirellulaceae bacterium]
MTARFFTDQTPVDDNLLRVLAHLPTSSLPTLVDPAFWLQLGDADFMRIAVHLAQKSYDEGGCPIGGVIIENATQRVVGKGHNRLVQDNDPYNHGETAAMRDAGSIDFSATTMFTTLTPCAICAHLLMERGFPRVVIGNSPNPTHNEQLLRDHGLEVDLLVDGDGASLYRRYQNEKPGLDLIDWKGVAALKKLENS